MAELKRRLPAILALAIAGLGAGGCDGCGDSEPAVPFKRVEAVPARAEPSPATGAPDAEQTRHARAALRRLQAAKGN